MSLLAPILCSVISPAVVLWFFHASDRRREPMRIVWTTFVLGMLSPLPVVLITPNLFAWFPSSNPFQQAVLMSFGMAAIPEEFAKLLVVRFYAARHRMFDEPMDGLVYGVVASLGFATSENILYAWTAGLSVTVDRSFTAIPLHAAVGAIMGYYVGRARFESQARLHLLARAFAVPMVVHGCYDFPLFAVNFASRVEHAWAQESWFEPSLLMLTLLVLVSAVAQALRLRRELAVQQSAEATPSRPDEPVSWERQD